MAGSGSGSGGGTERSKASGSIDKEYEMVDQVPQSFQPDSPSSTTQSPLPIAHNSPSLLSTFVSASQRLWLLMWRLCSCHRPPHLPQRR